MAQLIATRPELRPRIEGAVTNVDEARGAEAVHMEEVRRALDGLPPRGDGDDDIKFDIPGRPTGGIEDIAGESGASTGSDTVDTSHEGDDDIVVDIPNAQSTSSVPVDYVALVKGSADEVSGYISEHPSEADAVLAAEAAGTGGAPRAAVVLAARAAAEFNAGS